MSEATSKRILLIDDEPMVAKSMSEILHIEGYAVVIADGGKAGIDIFSSALEKEPFAAVITDLGMLGVDGRQVVSFVKNASPTTPVILLTGWGQWFEDNTGAPLPVDCILQNLQN